MPRGTLEEAADFITAQARQLSMLSLLIAISDENLQGLQGDAARAWQKAQSGWRTQLDFFGARYDKSKKAITGQAEAGVLSGGWKAFRTLSAADIVLSSPKRGGLKLNFKAIDYTSRELDRRRAYEGGGSIPKKPWRNWPQRFVDVGTVPFSCKVAAYLKGSSAKTIKEAQKELPLNSVHINWARLGREGRRIGTIRSQRAKVQAALRRALNAI